MSRRSVPAIDPANDIADDALVLVSTDGRVLESHSLYDILVAAQPRYPIQKAGGHDAGEHRLIDLFHCNAVRSASEAFGPNNRPLRTQAGNPISISIFNNDTKPHIIHGPGGSFPHGDFNSPIQPNAFEMKNGVVRTRVLKVGDNATAYIHGEPNSTNATFKVVVAATATTPPATP